MKRQILITFFLFLLGLLARYLWLLMVFLPNWSVTRFPGFGVPQHFCSAKNQRCSGWCFLFWMACKSSSSLRIEILTVGELPYQFEEVTQVHWFWNEQKDPNENSFKKPLKVTMCLSKMAPYGKSILKSTDLPGRSWSLYGLCCSSPRSTFSSSWTWPLSIAPWFGSRRWWVSPMTAPGK